MCRHDLASGSRYLLTTAEVVGSTAYWTERVWPRLSELSSGLKDLVSDRQRAAVFLGLIQQFTSSPTPWRVCDGCIGLFPVDRTKCREYAKRHAKRSSVVPPGTGPVSLQAANLGHVAAYGEAAEWVAAASVLFGIRAGAARKQGRRAHFYPPLPADDVPGRPVLHSPAVIERQDLPGIWTILLTEGHCLVEVDASALDAAEEALCEPIRALRRPDPDFCPGITARPPDAVRVGVICKGCKTAWYGDWPLSDWAEARTVHVGGCKSKKAYVYVVRAGSRHLSEVLP